MKNVSQQYSSVLFKSDLRGSTIGKDLHCFSTFNDGTYRQQGREAFGSLRFINDNHLAPGKSLSFEYRDVTELIIPIAGTLLFNSVEVQAEQQILFSGEKTSIYTIQNPYENDWVNFIHIGLTSSNPLTSRQFTIDNIRLEKFNQLTSLQLQENNTSLYGYIGIFEGRAKETYRLKNKLNGIFMYVINGAFEAENRLIEHRDGLTLWDLEEVDFEALAAHSILLLLELPLTAFSN